MPDRQWNVKRFVGERVEPGTRKKQLEVEWEETEESATLVRKHCPDVYEAFRKAEKNDFRILGVVDDPEEQSGDIRFAIEYVGSGRRDAKRLSELKSNFKEKLLEFFEQRAQYSDSQISFLQ
ncbi:hypothetical protein L596_007291 [Steinernema carpocapsae]|uniref:Uncharacterized protein n=1 Tax=Steinernema carpocapsae TaxID=34508 RepID=A0A4U5P8X8_STECR|nr:hypothetical protein L596_007291 [Steinernema carpocapsae]